MSRRADLLEVRVVTARYESAGVASYELALPSGGDLPGWGAGAHVDVHLPSGTVRQYSLWGDPREPDRYRIAVHEQVSGRGGSRELHRELRPGVVVTVSAPRNNFALVSADHYVFIAGGIGITPILALAREAERRGAEWSLVYAARDEDCFALRTEVESVGGDRVQFVTGPLDIAGLLETSTGATVYCCGPTGLMDDVTEAMRAAGRPAPFKERFAPTAPPTGELRADSGSFMVELARDGQVVNVPADLSILEAVRGAGIDVMSSCEMGICGTCETKVIAGEVDHRDDLLTDAERAEGSTMMICVSRAACPRLVLDL